MKRISVMICLLVLAVSSLWAQADTIKVAYRGNLIYIPVKVNGKPMTFLFDTGYSNTVVFQHALDSTTAVHEIETTVRDSGGHEGKLSEADVNIIVSSYDYDWKHTYYVAQDDSVLSKNCDGVLGIDYLMANNGICAKIDVRNQWVIFTRKKHWFDADEGKKVRCKLIDNRPLINVKISPKIKLKNVLFDTGFTGLFDLADDDFSRIMQSKKAEAFGKQVVDSRMTDMRGALGRHNREVNVLNLEKLEFGGLSFSGMESETGIESLLGTPFLQAAAVVIYNHAKRLKICPYTTVKNYRVDTRLYQERHGDEIYEWQKEYVTEAYYE